MANLSTASAELVKDAFRSSVQQEMSGTNTVQERRAELDAIEQKMLRLLSDPSAGGAGDAAHRAFLSAQVKAVIQEFRSQTLDG